MPKAKYLNKRELIGPPCYICSIPRVRGNWTPGSGQSLCMACSQSLLEQASRYCGSCEAVKSLVEFPKGKGKGKGARGQCKACYRKHRNQPHKRKLAGAPCCACGAARDGTNWAIQRGATICVPCFNRLTDSGQKICGQCKVTKPLASFVQHARTKSGLRSQCRSCQRAARQTLDACMSEFANGARSRTRVRIAAGKADSECTLTGTQLRTLYDKQEGRCYYTGMPMNIETYSDFHCSLERLSQETGYALDNVAFVCLEFNTRTQWSGAKFDEALELARQPIDESILKLLVATEVIINPQGSRFCSSCKSWWKRDEWTCVRRQTCNRCQEQLYNRTPLMHLRILLNAAKARSIRRCQNAKRTGTCNFELRITDMQDLFLEQRGRCYYSDVPLCFGIVDWGCSLERLDSTQGYVRNNVALICKEFNSTDHSAVAPGTASGSGQWSRAKFAAFKNSRLELLNSLRDKV